MAVTANVREKPASVTSSLLLRVCLLLALLLIAAPAQADLASEAELVASTWSANATRAQRLPPLFLEYGRVQTISLPRSAVDGTTPTCTTVAFLTERSTDFLVRLDAVAAPKRRPRATDAQRSVAGVASLVRCGEEKAQLARLSVELRVARAALEVVVGEGTGPMPALTAVLPDRATGPLAPLIDAGQQLPLDPLDVRAQRAESRARRAGASLVRRSALSPSFHGSGAELLELAEGCHLIELFGEAAEFGPIDLDAEARDAVTERVLARDRSESPDARLELCVGTRSAIKLVFAGAQGATEVLLSDAIFPLPRGLPSTWGPRARAGMAAALRRRHVRDLPHPPDATWLGIAGPTRVPVELTLGSCYLAVVSAARGDLRSMTLAAHVDGRTALDSNGGLLDGTAVAFCAEKSERAALEVDARGLGVAWVLSLWKVGTVTLGEER